MQLRSWLRGLKRRPAKAFIGQLIQKFKSSTPRHNERRINMLVKYNVHYDNEYYGKDPDARPSVKSQGLISGDNFEDCLKKFLDYYPRNDIYFFSFEVIEELLDEYDVKDLLK